MRMRAIRILWWACLLALPVSSIAHASGEYARRGPSVAIQGVVAIPTWEGQLRAQVAGITPSAPEPSVSVSGGLDLRVGYRFHDRVSAEMGFEWIAAYSLEQGGLNVGGASNWMYYVDAKVYLLTDAIQPYLMLGMGAYHLDYTLPGTLSRVDGTSFSPRFAGGVDFYLDWRFGLTAEINYVIGTRQLVDFDRVAVSLGAFYRF